MEPPPTNGILEEFRLDFQDCWQRLPNKGFFFVLLAAWLCLFHFLGNSTLGYIHSLSLFQFMCNAYHPYLLDWVRTLDVEAIAQWMSESDEGHCVVVPFLVVGLFWWKRKELLGLPLRLWWPGLVVVGLALLLHVFAFLVQQPKVSIIALFTGLYGLMGLAWGPAWLRAGFFPFFLFVFCIPLGDQAQPITFRLRLLVCQLVEFVSNYILAIDVQRDGTLLSNSLNHYRYEVAAACSGIRSLIATLGLATVYAFLCFRSGWRRALLIASAFPLAVLGNLVRMLAIIIAAEIGGQVWGNKVHDGGPAGVFGLLPYVPAFLGLIGLGRLLRESSAPTARLPLSNTA